MVGHPERLWGMGPGVRMNGGTTATIAEIGLREPIPEVPRPAGRQRLMVLGDSTFFGHGVDDDQTMEAQLQRELRQRGLDVDVVNGAIPGYSTAQTRLLLDDVCSALAATVLLVGNLWSDNNFDLFQDADLLRTRASLSSGLAAHSAFMRLMAGGLDRFRDDSEARVVTWTRTSAFPSTGRRRVAVQDYARNLDQVVRDAAARGIGVVFIAPSNRDTVTDGRTADQSWAVYFDAQAQVADCHGLQRLDTLPAFQAALADGGTLDGLFIDEMHPTTQGHGLIAETVSQGLLGSGWPLDGLLGTEAPCAVDNLEDPFPGGRSTTVNQLSPQSNLYPGAVALRGPQAATAREGEVLPPGAWIVSGEVQAASWPVTVVVRDVEDRPLSSTVLASSDTPLRLIVGQGLDRVVVQATDAAGGQGEAVVTPVAAVVEIQIGD